MPKKKLTTETGAGTGAAPARALAPKPKRATTAKHAKAKSAPALTSASVEPVTGAVDMSVQDEVALVAFLYFERRGFQGGSPQEDWMRAEQEVLLRRSLISA